MIFNNPGTATDYGDQQGLPSEASGSANLILIMGRALLTLGAPAHRLEAALVKVAERLGLSAQFFSTPTALMAALGDGHRQHTYLVRVNQAGTDFSRLTDITEIVEKIGLGSGNPALAAEQVSDILNRKPLYNAWLSFLAYVMISMPTALMLGGGWNEAILAGIAGSAVGILAIFTGRFTAVDRLFVPLCATAVSFITFCWCGWQQQTAVMPATMAGMIALLPGLGLTIATRELSTGHLVSGSSRLAGVLLVFATLGFGLALGGTIAQALVGTPPSITPTLVGAEYQILATLVATIGFVLLFNAYLRDWAWVLVAVIIAWYASMAGNMLLDAPLGAFAGALVVGLVGNIFARVTTRPSSILHTPGLLLLVPGSIGFRSLSDLLNADIISGIQTGFLAVITAVALTTGMIVASVLIAPKNEL